MQDDIAEFLMGLELDQLERLKEWTAVKAKEKKNRIKINPATPHTNDLEALADSAGLDISALIRASKHY